MSKWKHEERMWEVATRNGESGASSDKEWLQQIAYILMPEDEVLAADQPEGTGERITFSATYMKQICERLAKIADNM